MNNINELIAFYTYCWGFAGVNIETLKNIAQQNTSSTLDQIELLFQEKVGKFLCAINEDIDSLVENVEDSKNDNNVFEFLKNILDKRVFHFVEDKLSAYNGVFVKNSFTSGDYLFYYTKDRRYQKIYNHPSVVRSMSKYQKAFWVGYSLYQLEDKENLLPNNI